MEQYILKSALVAEVKSLLAFYSKEIEDYKEDPWAMDIAKRDILQEILSFIDTLEVKEVGIDGSNIDDLLEEEGIDPNSKEAKVFKESYYMALEKLKEKKGELL